MSQFELTGGPEGPRDERLWARILRLQKEGYYDVRASAQILLDEGFFSEDWHARVDLNAAMSDIETASKRRNPDGTRRAIKTEKPRQYRIWDWATYEEALFDLQNKLAGWTADGELIRIDAGELIRRFPKRKREVMGMLPESLRPFVK